MEMVRWTSRSRSPIAVELRKAVQNMGREITKTKFSQLPHWVQARIKEYGDADAENWIQRPIPALNHRTIWDLSHDPEGEKLLREYFSRIIGRF